jgi:hypothetical protein
LPNVHRDVVYLAPNAAQELALGTASLEVEATQHAAARAAVVVLDEPLSILQQGLPVSVLAVGLEKKTTFVAEYAGFDEHYAVETKRPETHRFCSSRLMR